MAKWHPMKVDTLRKHLEQIVSTARLSTIGLLDLSASGVNLNKFVSEILKDNTAWITDVQVLIWLHETLTYAVGEANYVIREESISLSQLLGDERCNELIDRTLRYFENFPRTYQIYFHLPSILRFECEEIKLTDTDSLIQVLDERTFDSVRPRNEMRAFDLIPSNHSRSFPDSVFRANQVYFRTSSKGFSDRGLRSRAPERALARLKHFAQLGVATGDFYFGGFLLNGMPESHAVIVDTTDGDDLGQFMGMDIALAQRIATLKLSHKFLTPRAQSEIGQVVGIDEFPSRILQSLGAAMGIIGADVTSSDVGEILTACEWLFDSEVSDNETIAFLEVCMGIEAILGAYGKERSVTHTLADRLAYTLGKSRADRRTLAERFVQFYDVRSDLVHGRVAVLEPKQKIELSWGKLRLAELIRREIQLQTNAK